MNKILNLTIILLIVTCLPALSNAQVKDYYDIPEVITFDSLQYKLSASYHPQDGYYKQEYIPAGELPDHFNKMVTIDFAITDADAKSMVIAKAKELQERKKSDPVVQMDVNSNPNTGEYILDFVLSEQQGGRVIVVERNVYRYKNYTDNAGHKGVLLFAISQRAYDIHITSFFGNLRNTRVSDINKLAQYDMPKITVK